MIESILIGVAAGAVLAVTGYLKNINQAEGYPVFDVQKFLTTIIIGAAAGGVSRILGVSYDAATTMIASAGITTIVEYIVKALVRWWRWEYRSA
ncbi:MAG: hypothetical protein QW334_00355 [Thermofilum sp.]